MSESAATSMRQKTVLMVEDQPQVRRLVYHALKSRYRVLEAGDADAAIALLDSEPIDLVLLDLHLPPRSDVPGEGLRVHDRIRDYRPRPPVIVTTGNDSPAVRQALLDGGVEQFLNKPLDVARLLQIVDRLLGETP